jgi:hypothetical protein
MGMGAPAVSIETGRVVQSPVVGWRGWLDAETVVGTLQGGIYRMPFAQAFGLAPATTGATEATGAKAP